VQKQWRISAPLSATDPAALPSRLIDPGFGFLQYAQRFKPARSTSPLGKQAEKTLKNAQRQSKKENADGSRAALLRRENMPAGNCERRQAMSFPLTFKTWFDLLGKFFRTPA